MGWGTANGETSKRGLGNGRPAAVETLRPPAHHNLPARLTSFVGREAERVEIAGLLAASRVVTLTGAGGSGKTRLAVEVGRDAVGTWEDGVWWVDLAGLAEPGLVAAEVAASVGLTPSPGEPPLESLIWHLRDRRALLLLDNCEHLISAAAALVSAITRDCPRATVMVTSREGLHVEGEAIFPVPPLSVPASDGSDAEASESVRLFVERARQVRPNFRLDAATTPAVVEICRRLDGIPLAIELAAARVRMLTPAQIAEGLSDRFRLLTGGPRTALPRQRTLDASVEWSYRMLSPQQQLVFARLSVFAGTFGLDAAEHVCGTDGVESVEVLDLLAGLVARSLVQVEEGDQEARYRLLESVRVYARDRLGELDDLGQARDRHLQYFAGLAAEASVGLVTDFDATFNRLGAEVDNLRAAMDWAMTAGQPAAVIDIAAPLTTFWAIRGLYNDIFARLNTAVSVEGLARAERARGLVAASMITYMGGDFATGYDFADAALSLEDVLEPKIVPLALVYRAWTGFFARRCNDAQIWSDLERALDLSEADDDPVRRGRVMLFASTLEMFGRSVDRGKAVLAEMIEASAHASAHPVLITPLRLFRANAWWWDGDTGQARALYAEVINAGTQLGYHYFVSLALAQLAFIDILEGDAESARSRIIEARRIAPRAAMGHVLMAEGLLAGAEGDPAAALQKVEQAIELETGSLEMFVAMAEITAGECALALGDTAKARALFESARSRSIDPGCPSGVARGSVALAVLLLADGDVERAASLAYDGLAAAAHYGDRVGVPVAIVVAAALAAEVGAPDRAARLLGSAAALSPEVIAIGASRPLVGVLRDATTATVRSELGDEEFERCFAEGEQLTYDDAIAYAQRGRGQRGRPSSGWQSLTPTEVEVVRLVADGRSNAEIAERLFVSPNTVKTHLAHVYTKLDLSSRAELAAEAARRDL